MANIYFCGHGEWPTSKEASAFVNLPKNTTFKVYTPVGRFLSLQQAGLIIQSAPGALAPDQVFNAYQSTPNLRLYPAPEFKDDFNGFGAGVVMVTAATSLKDLLLKYEGNDLHWCACRVRFQGLDTTEGGFNDDYNL